MSLELCLLCMAAMRAALGLAPIVAPARASRLLGFPPEHDNPTARLMGRLFGVRDIALGVIAYAALHGQVSLPFALLLNFACDLADAAMISIPLVRRQGIDQAATWSLAFASLGAASWILVWWVWVA